MMPSVLGALEANRRHKSKVSLYEIGKGYLPERGNDKGEPHEGARVRDRLAALPPAKARASTTTRSRACAASSTTSRARWGSKASCGRTTTRRRRGLMRAWRSADELGKRAP
jgi:hypothetical protein